MEQIRLAKAFPRLYMLLMLHADGQAVVIIIIIIKTLSSSMS